MAVMSFMRIPLVLWIVPDIPGIMGARGALLANLGLDFSRSSRGASWRTWLELIFRNFGGNRSRGRAQYRRGAKRISPPMNTEKRVFLSAFIGG